MSETKRFGLTDEQLAAVVRRHAADAVRCGLYVPTEDEVRTLPLDRLGPILLDWLWESPSELIPTDEQAAAVMSLLGARPDASAADYLVAQCREYLNA